jgi:DNA-binding NarL/FixJ family response regulator
VGLIRFYEFPVARAGENGSFELNRRCVSVVIAARNPILYGLATLLRAVDDFNVVASCRDGASCIEAIRSLSPNLALLDVSLPGQGGLQVLAAIRSERLCTRVVFLSPDTSEKPTDPSTHRVPSKREAPPHPLLSFLREVASEPKRLVLRSPNRLRYGTRDAAKDPSTALTERERQVMRLVCEGQSNKEVGRRLNVPESTVKIHLHHVYQKLAIRNRTALGARAAHAKERSLLADGHRNKELPPPIAKLGDSSRTQPIDPTHPPVRACRKSRDRKNA